MTLKKYHSAKDYLDAAESRETPVAELEVLASVRKRTRESLEKISKADPGKTWAKSPELANHQLWVTLIRWSDIVWQLNRSVGRLIWLSRKLPMDEKRALLCHFLAALAYRTQKALRGAPESFQSFRAAPTVRTPLELIRHMESVLGYARTFFIGGAYNQVPLSDFESEIVRFHKTIEDLAQHLETGTPLNGISPEQLLQGPFSDAMTHAGQLAMLRRLAGSPVPSENFVYADVRSSNLGPSQPAPVMPGRRREGEWPKLQVVNYHGLRDWDKARELYRQAEKTYQLAYAAMASFGSDEEIVKTREGYMKAEKKLYEYHLLAAEQAGATNEIKEIRIMLNVLAPK